MSLPNSSTAAAPTSWRASPLVKASVACHAGAVAAAMLAPASWPWAAGAVLINHAVLTGSGLWPRSTWLDDNMVRLPDASASRNEVALTIDDGPEPDVTPAVLDLLDAHGAKATFFCIADRASLHPVLVREIIRRGHSVQNHSQRHTHRFSLMGPKGFRREVGQAQQTLADITGQWPRFFRAPAGLRNPTLAPTLHALQLQLVSWTRRGFDTMQRQPDKVLARLSHRLAAGDIVLLHDGNAARTLSGRAVLLDVLPPLLARFKAQGLRAVTLPQAVASGTRA